MTCFGPACSWASAVAMRNAHTRLLEADRRGAESSRPSPPNRGQPRSAVSWANPRQVSGVSQQAISAYCSCKIIVAYEMDTLRLRIMC